MVRQGLACSLADEPVFAMIAPNFAPALSFFIQYHRQAALDVVPRGIWRHIQCSLRPLAPRRGQHSHRYESTLRILNHILTRVSRLLKGGAPTSRNFLGNGRALWVRSRVAMRHRPAWNAGERSRQCPLQCITRCWTWPRSRRKDHHCVWRPWPRSLADENRPRHELGRRRTSLRRWRS